MAVEHGGVKETNTRDSTLIYSETVVTGGVLVSTGNGSGRRQRVEVLTASLKRWEANTTADTDYALAA